MARALALVAALAQLRAADAAAAVSVEARPNPIYSTVTQNCAQGLRLRRRGHGRTSEPPVRADDGQDGLQGAGVVGYTFLSINLVAGKSWPLASDEGTDLYLSSLIDDRKGAMNQLESPTVIARIPTPTVMHGGEK